MCVPVHVWGWTFLKEEESLPEKQGTLQDCVCILKTLLTFVGLNGDEYFCKMGEGKVCIKFCGCEFVLG